jgi:excisionase family DNA binding protein
VAIPRLLTIDEVSTIARAPRSSVQHWIYTGQLPSRRIGRRRLVSEPDLARFLGLDARGSLDTRGRR